MDRRAIVEQLAACLQWLATPPSRSGKDESAVPSALRKTYDQFFSMPLASRRHHQVEQHVLSHCLAECGNWLYHELHQHHPTATAEGEQADPMAVGGATGSSSSGVVATGVERRFVCIARDTLKALRAELQRMMGGAREENPSSIAAQCEQEVPPYRTSDDETTKRSKVDDNDEGEEERVWFMDDADIDLSPTDPSFSSPVKPMAPSSSSSSLPSPQQPIPFSQDAVAVSSQLTIAAISFAQLLDECIISSSGGDVETEPPISTTLLSRQSHAKHHKKALSKRRKQFDREMVRLATLIHRLTAEVTAALPPPESTTTAVAESPSNVVVVPTLLHSAGSLFFEGLWRQSQFGAHCRDALLRKEEQSRRNALSSELDSIAEQFGLTVEGDVVPSATTTTVAALAVGNSTAPSTSSQVAAPSFSSSSFQPFHSGTAASVSALPSYLQPEGSQEAFAHTTATPKRFRGLIANASPAPLKVRPPLQSSTTTARAQTQERLDDARVSRTQPRKRSRDEVTAIHPSSSSSNSNALPSYLLSKRKSVPLQSAPSSVVDGRGPPTMRLSVGSSFGSSISSGRPSTAGEATMLQSSYRRTAPLMDSSSSFSSRSSTPQQAVHNIPHAAAAAAAHPKGRLALPHTEVLVPSSSLRTPPRRPPPPHLVRSSSSDGGAAPFLPSVSLLEECPSTPDPPAQPHSSSWTVPKCMEGPPSPSPVRSAAAGGVGVGGAAPRGRSLQKPLLFDDDESEDDDGWMN